MVLNKNFKDLLTQAIAFHQQNNLEGAREIYASILSAHPNDFDTLFLLGTVNLQLNNFSESVTLLSKAALIDKSYPEVFFNLALAHEKLEQFDKSLKNYEFAILLQSNYVEARINYGNLLITLKQYGEALKNYDSLISLNPNYAEAYNNRGNIFQALLKMDEALSNYDKAISLNPNYAEAFNNRGNIFKYLGKISEAQNNYSHALSLNPNFLPALYNSAVNSFDQGDMNGAIKLYKELIAIDPKHPDGNWNLSICYLMIGNYELGWQQYEYRWQTPRAPFYQNRRFYSKPLWSGKESLENKIILVYFEQGFGDTIQFCRYVFLFHQLELGAKVILQVQRPLFGLLKCLGDAINLIPDDCTPPSFDYHCPLLSLPLAFETNLKTIPNYYQYIQPNQNKVDYWKNKLGLKTKSRVGLAWSSTSNFKDDFKRSMSFKQFTSLFPDNYDDFEFICLQKEIKSCDQETFLSANSIQFFGDQIEDFSDTAALISQLDLVISTCTSIPHLSCAMGIPTWILLSHVPDWRWLLERTDSPWYPSATLYRQKLPGDWNQVLQDMKYKLSNLSKCNEPTLLQSGLINETTKTR